MKRDNEADLPDALLEEAASWHLRSEDDQPGAMDWDAFTVWLEADPRHRVAYDQMALTADAIDRHKADLAAENLTHAEEASPDSLVPDVSARSRSARWRWGGLAIAASLAAIVAIPQFIAPAPGIYATDTASQRIALADGSSVLLAPHSRLKVEGRAQDRMDITGGAIFDIRHDPSRTLTISAGDVTVSDIGTRFDVQQQDNAVRVAVAEGQVRVSSATMVRPVALTAGNRLTFDADAGTATVSPVKTTDVGSWQNKRLSYDDAPLALVAADLHRYGAVKVEVPDSLRSRRFSGTLIVDNGEKALRDLVQLMDLRLGGHAGAWRLEQR